MKRVLLLDGSFSAQYLKKNLDKKFLCFTVGKKKLLKGANFSSSNHFDVNYTDLCKVREVIKNNKIDYLLPGCTDTSLSTYAALCKNFDQNVNLTERKDIFSKFCRQKQINVPREFFFEDVKSFPVIVKPTNSFSGRGITIVENPKYLTKAIQKAISYDSYGRYIIQEFIPGELFSCSAFFVCNDIVFFTVKENCNFDKFSVDESYIFNFRSSIKEKILNIVKKFFNALGSHQKFIHFQFMVFEDKIFVLEMMLRCPGDLYGRLIELSTGFQYHKYYIKAYLNEFNVGDDCTQPSRHYYYKRVTYKASAQAKRPLIKAQAELKELYYSHASKWANNLNPYQRFGVGFLLKKALYDDERDLSYDAYKID